MAQGHEGQRVVLIALDGSETADNAFNWYLKEMRQPNDYVYGIIVPEFSFSGVSAIKLVGPLADVNALSAEFQNQYQVVEQLCANYTAKLRSAGVKGQVDSMSGDKPGPTICEQAGKLKASCIVMGTRGHSGLKKLILGSVSNYVLHHAGVPCSVIPLKQKAEEESQGQKK
ncbi:universal stress protein Slr1101-like isoform X1 [Mercenaria mercenaria]|uniref:universal stress protein Slr1101-like isoform X1 n=1 Tax=Mercenaria mercenaria TaxID=6596 RepID=UPI00234EC862|nr:universal stress protein Slr1101-like isoform X1 [Mercenaria mercenaria]